MQINANTPSLTAAPSAQTVTSKAQTNATPANVSPPVSDTVTLSAEAKAKLATEQQASLATGSTVTPLGSGWGNEPPK